MAFGFRLKELLNGLILSPIVGALVSLIVYILSFDASKIPGSPINSSDVLVYSTVSGAIAFAGVLWLSIKDAVLSSKEQKIEDAKEKIEELMLNNMIEDLYNMEKERLKQEIEELKNKQQQNKS